MRRTVTAVAFCIIAIFGFASACYDRPTCSFRCGEDSTCPYEYFCATDGWCKLKGTAQGHVCDGEVPGPDAGVDANPLDSQ